MKKDGIVKKIHNDARTLVIQKLRFQKGGGQPSNLWFNPLHFISLNSPQGFKGLGGVGRGELVKIKTCNNVLYSHWTIW